MRSVSGCARLFVSVLPFLLSSAAVAQPAPAHAGGPLRWVHARVVSATGEAVTLQLRDSTLAIARGDLAADAVTPGSVVEVHYRDSKGERRGIYVFAVAADTGLSKRPGRSFHAVITQVKKSSLRIDAGGRKTSLDVEKRAIVVDAAGTRVGKAAVLAAVRPGDEVLVKYVETSSDMVAGDVVIPGTDLKVLEVRRLGPSLVGATARR